MVKPPHRESVSQMVKYEILDIAFWEHYIKEGPHASLSGSNDQTIDNIQRTLRAYSDSESFS